MDISSVTATLTTFFHKPIIKYVFKVFKGLFGLRAAFRSIWWRLTWKRQLEALPLQCLGILSEFQMADAEYFKFHTSRYAQLRSLQDRGLILGMQNVPVNMILARLHPTIFAIHHKQNLRSIKR